MKVLLATLLCSAAWAQSTPVYQVFAVQYADLKDFAVPALVAGADQSRKMDIAMMFWVIKGEGRNILFDCGFYREKFMKQWHPANYEKPSIAVARAGLKPEDITDVVISHIHWDHADGFDLFPNAKVWIQKEELAYYAGEAWQGHRRTAADADDIVGLVRFNTEGRLNLIDGDDREIFPGIRAYTGGKHTFASQFLTVHTAGGTVVLASDNVYLNENLEKHVPIAATLDADSNLRTQDRMKQLATRPGLIIPGHDPAVMKAFPAVAPGVVRIE